VSTSTVTTKHILSGVDRAGQLVTLSPAFTATTDYVVAVASAVSGGEDVGAYITKISGSQFRVTPTADDTDIELAVIGTTVATSTHATTMLALINAALERFATNPVQSISIGGRTLVRPTLSDLLKLRAHYTYLVAQADADTALAAGTDPGGRVKVRFDTIS
jgi:hypothetical protein